MELNPEIKKRFKNTGHYDICMAYLLARHFELNLDAFALAEHRILSSLMEKEIISMDSKAALLIPLFKPEKKEDDRFGWVKKEYVALFKAKNARKGGHIKESTLRIKKFLKSNPNYGKDDIIAATKLYLDSTDWQYIRDPHYFISKGVGQDRTEDVLNWIEKVHELRESKKEANSSNTPISHKMQ